MCFSVCPLPHWEPPLPTAEQEVPQCTPSALPLPPRGFGNAQRQLIPRKSSCPGGLPWLPTALAIPTAHVISLIPLWMLLSGGRNSLYLGFASPYSQLSKWVLPRAAHWTGKDLKWLRLGVWHFRTWYQPDISATQPGWVRELASLAVSGSTAPSAPRPAEKHWHCHPQPQVALWQWGQRCIYTYILFRHQGHREEVVERKKGQGAPSLYS